MNQPDSTAQLAKFAQSLAQVKRDIAWLQGHRAEFKAQQDKNNLKKVAKKH